MNKMTLRVTSADGTRIAYDRKGTGPAVILVGGTLDDGAENAPLARLLSWAHLNRFITAAAPGLGDVLLVGKVWEAATREAGPAAYDLVVLDAPPTGRVVPFLRAPETVAELARVGPIRHQADRLFPRHLH